MPDFSPCGAIVDFLRSCYSVNMRFYRDEPSTEVPVKWFFCEEGTDREVPATVFCSRNYDGEADGPPSALGEVRSGPTMWRDGSPPPVELRGRPCGPLDGWLNGNAKAPAVAPDSIAWGLPLCCAPPGGGERKTLCEMGLDTALVAYGLATIVNAAAHNQFVFANQAAAQLFGSAPSAGGVQHLSGILPTWLWYANSDHGVIAICGTTNEAQFIGQYWASLGGAVPSGGFKMNAFTAAVANGVFTELMFQGFPSTIPVAIVGHSLGGNVADFIAARFRQLEPTRDVCVLTLGTPRFGGEGLPEILRGRHLNIGLPGDLVPFYVPDPAAFFWAVSFLFPTIWAPWFSYLPTSPLRTFNAVGGVDPSGGLLPNVVDFLAAVVFWSESFLASIPATHSIASYCAALKIAAAGDPAVIPSSLINKTVFDNINSVIGP